MKAQTLPASPGWKSLLLDARVLLRPRSTVLALSLALILIGRVAGLLLPASIKYVIDDVIGNRNMSLLTPLVLVVLGAIVARGLTSLALTQLMSKASHRLVADLRRRVQAHVGRLPVAYFDANKTGALLSRIMNDVESLGSLVGGAAVAFCGSLITAVIALVILVITSPWLTAVALTPILILMLILRRSLATLRPAFLDRRRIQAEVTGRLSESLGGVRVVKGYNAESREAQVFSTGIHRLLENALHTLTGISLVSLAATLLLGIDGALVLFLGARQVSGGALTLGEFVKFTAFLAVLVGPMFEMVSVGPQLAEAVGGLERTRELLAERPEDEDPRRLATLGVVRGEVRFEQVSFAYTPGNSVLQDISFEAKPGTVTALVGPSGAGKSTVMSLLAAFHAPSAGTVRIDGVDLTTARLSSYRSQLGVVPQQAFLFDGTIRENVVFARPAATEKEFLEACRIAHVDEFAEALENKYETVVGERGVRLSGGQCQRVSIARAILANPRILILDEATSSLDSHSEALIQQGLAHLMTGRTTFVIAHRLSTIRLASLILVMEDGRILESGDHQSLLSRHGRYYELYTRQHNLHADLFFPPSGFPGPEQSPIRGEMAPS